jgi:energy-coupling factor transporter ATP-binding protein EcfA2
MSYVPSTKLRSNLSFRYCRSCGYVDVEEDFRRVRLPPNSSVLLSWLEKKSEETKKKEGVIGRGRTVRRDEEVVEVEAEVKREALRLSLDAVFYGGVLHVVRDVRVDERCVEERCPAVFELERHEEEAPDEGELLFSEPAFLYDAAADILRSRRVAWRGSFLEPLRGLADFFLPACVPARDLDRWQRKALAKILRAGRHGVVVVVGPPGTGKTSVVAAAACILARKGRRVLITALSNVAVDNALERVLERCGDVEVIRFGIRSKVSQAVRSRLKRLTGDVAARIKEGGVVVGMTAAKLAALHLVRGLYELTGPFDYVFVDEASMMPFAVAAVPFLYGVRRVVLGDPRQLAPPLDEEGEMRGEKELKEEHVPVVPLVEAVMRRWNSAMLRRQRRGRAEIFRYVSDVFYRGKLDLSESPDAPLDTPAKYGDLADEILASDKALVWVEVGGRWKAGGGSYYNVEEAELAVWLYLRLLEYGAAEHTVILATYRGQERLLRRAINELRRIKGGPSGWDVVYTVNKFQGREADVAIYSAVHNEVHDALKDYRRFNVAISRARLKAVVLSSLGDNADNLPWMLAYKKTAFKVDASTLRVPREVRRTIRAAESRLKKSGIR